MRTSKIYLLVACFLATGTITHAQEPTLTKKGVLAEKVYNATALPGGDWKELTMNSVVNDLAAPVTTAAADGVLTIQSTNNENQFSQQGWYLLGPGFDHTTGYTIEVKAKVNAADAYGAFNIQGFDKSGKGFRVGIHPDKLIEFTDPLLATQTVADNLTNDDQFYTFRLAVEPNGRVHVYRDLVYLGAFDSSAFVEDNLIRNGGFEDAMGVNTTDISTDWVEMTKVEADGDKTFGRGILNRLKVGDIGSDANNTGSYTMPEASKGTWMMYANNVDGIGVAGNPNGDLFAHPRYTAIPVKEGVSYSASVDAYFAHNDHGWRQLRLWWNEAFHRHSDYGNAAHQNNFYDVLINHANYSWKSYSKTFSTNDNRGSVTDIKSVIFDLPNGNFKLNPAAFDNAYLKEVIDYEDNDSYFFFGKSMGMESVDVKIEYITFDLTGAYAPAATATAWTGAVSPSWDDPANWTNGVPASGQNISFAENVYLPLALDGANLEIGDLDLTNASAENHLIIPTGASLKVTGTLTGVTDEKLTIDISSDHVSGSFIYPQGQTAEATIWMKTKAFTDNAAAAGSKYHWQYIATAVDQLDVNPAFNGTALRYWNEAGSGNKYWKGVANGDKLAKFKGYEITAPTSQFITYSGQLINEDFNSGEMAFTAGAAFPGQYILGNSYTAAVMVEEIEFGSAMEETVYLFNTGNYTQSASGSVGNDAGQYTAIPKNVAEQLGVDRIPSLQSYLVKTLDDTTPTEGVTIAIDYDQAVAADNAPMRNGKTYAYGLVTLTSDNFSDKLWLFVDDTFTRGFDNGFDGKKFVDMSSAAQVYAVESDGTYQVNSIPALNGTTLGFLANELDSEYTLTFEYFGIEGNDQILLRDKLTGEVINITAEGSTYTFTASGAAKANRFELITRETTAIDNAENSSLDVYVVGNSIVVKQNELLNGTIAIYDMSGKLLLQEAFAALETTIATDLATGSYIVRLANEKTAVSKKVSIVK